MTALEKGSVNITNNILSVGRENQEVQVCQYPISRFPKEMHRGAYSTRHAHGLVSGPSIVMVLADTLLINILEIV